MLLGPRLGCGAEVRGWLSCWIGAGQVGEGAGTVQMC